MNRTIKISFKHLMNNPNWEWNEYWRLMIEWYDYKEWLEWEKRGYIKKGGYSKLRTKEVSK